MSSVPMMFRQFALLGAATAILAGCATPCCVGIPPSPVVATPTKITATGYGSTASYTQYTTGQQKLMAMRAAQVDAFRALAERVHGFRITGSTSVSAFATQSDTIRSYVDSFIRGARVTGVNAIADGNYEATVELDITPQFYSCVQTYANCGYFPNHNYYNNSNCWPSGCGVGSAGYVSY
jgi:hypothetical protein